MPDVVEYGISIKSNRQSRTHHSSSLLISLLSGKLEKVLEADIDIQERIWCQKSVDEMSCRCK